MSLEQYTKEATPSILAKKNSIKLPLSQISLNSPKRQETLIKTESKEIYNYSPKYTESSPRKRGRTPENEKITHYFPKTNSQKDLMIAQLVTNVQELRSRISQLEFDNMSRSLKVKEQISNFFFLHPRMQQTYNISNLDIIKESIEVKKVK